MAQADGEVIYARHRTLRDLGEDEPGISLPREETEELDLLDRLGDQQAFVTIYEDGTVIVDLQTDS